MSKFMPRAMCCAAAAFAIGVFPACTSTPTPIAAAAPIASQAAIAGLRQPRSDLLTAGQPDATAWRALASDGVVVVVNLRPASELPGRDERAEVAAAGMAYHEIPVAGVGDLTPDNAARLWQLVAGSEGRVLVHCASGNRAGALLAIGAAHAGAMSPEQALMFGRSAGLASPAMEAAVRERLGLPAQ